MSLVCKRGVAAWGTAKKIEQPTLVKVGTIIRDVRPVTNPQEVCQLNPTLPINITYLEVTTKELIQEYIMSIDNTLESTPSVAFYVITPFPIMAIVAIIGGSIITVGLLWYLSKRR